jgi:polysaccharide pyruvyl transferase WcaK-like protein
MKKHFRIGVTGVNPYNGNRGVGALAFSTIYLLKKSADELDRDVRITVIGPNFGKSKFDICGKSIEVSCIMAVSVFSFKNILRLFTNPKMLLSFKEYLKLDIILCMGEGDSFSDIYGKIRFNSIDDQHKMARFFRKDYVLLPQTIGPFNDAQVSKKAKKSIEKSRLVLVRDRLSFNYVKAHTKQQNLKEMIDVAFFMPFTRKRFRNNKINVGLNISSLLWHGGYTHNNQFGMRIDYKQLVRQIIDYFISQADVHLHLVPHVVHSSSHVENDYEVCRKIQNEYDTDRITLAPFFLDPIDAKNYISGLDYFVGARMHACIAAFSSGVPVYPIAYSRKFNGLFAETLEYPYMGDLINESEEQLMSNLKLAFENKEILADKIQYSLEGIVMLKENVLKDELKSIFDETKSKNNR